MPRYSVRTLHQIQYSLIKYRGIQINPNMPSLMLFQYNNFLHKDSIDGQIDPFPNKVMVAPSTK